MAGGFLIVIDTPKLQIQVTQQTVRGGEDNASQPQQRLAHYPHHSRHPVLSTQDFSRDQSMSPLFNSPSAPLQTVRHSCLLNNPPEPITNPAYSSCCDGMCPLEKLHRPQ